MALRIKRIKVDRGGPLRSDFEFEPGDLNLIYGKNETGKTYVVESLIKFLFKTSAGTPADWKLRDWDVRGTAIVSGLESDPVSFTTGGNKLEDYWNQEGTGLPPDLSRLLVVRAGETVLAKSKDKAKDGVGRAMLKDYLSGEGLLDRVAKKIQRTLRNLEIGDGQIEGDERGKLGDRKELETDVRDLQTLLEEAEEGHTSGDVYSLQQQKKALDAEAEALWKAERHHAAQLDREIKKLDREKRDLPTGEKLGELGRDIMTYESNNRKIGTESEKLKERERTKDDCRWAKEALGVYGDVTSGATGSGPKQVLVLLALLSLIATVALPTLELRMVSAGLSVLFFAITYRDMTKALSSAGENTELERLKAEYRTKFGTDLTDRAVLQAKLKELEENQVRAKHLRTYIKELSDNTRTLENRITETLRGWTHTEVPANEWRDHIQNLKEKNADLEDQIDSNRDELTKLAIPPAEYLDQNPGTERNPGRYAALSEKRQITGEELEREEDKRKNLMGRVSQETSAEGSDWGELINRLRKKREGAAEKYREMTADILAQNKVYKSIEALRKQENSRIAEGLKREELTEPLHALTGRYQSIRLEDDKDLILTSDSDEDYPLASMSTGAQEQIFLALRMGFASIAMEGETGFFILDDAFQHSDWGRRIDLVARTLSLVESGWQVFYFTMDDHIKRLFEDVGSKMGDGFKSHSLG